MIQSGDDDWIIRISPSGIALYLVSIYQPNKDVFLCALGATVVRIYLKGCRAAGVKGDRIHPK